MDFGTVLANAGWAFLLSVLASVAAFALGLWITYTVIWRAVRRGLAEHEKRSVLERPGVRGYLGL